MDKPNNVIISKRLVLVNSISSIFVRVLNVFVLFGVYQYLLEQIPTEEFAIFPVVAAVMVFAPLFSSLMTGGIARYVTEAYSKADDNQIIRLISSIVPVLACASAVLMLLGLIFTAYIDRFLVLPAGLVTDARVMMGLLILSFCIQTALLPFAVGFDVRQRYVELNLIMLCREILRMLVLLLLLYALGPKVIWVVVSTVFANLVYVAAITVRSRRLLPNLLVKLSVFDRRLAFMLMNFGIWTSFGQLASMINRAAGAIVLNRLATPLDVTAYHIGSMMDQQIRGLTSIASAPVQPALTSMYAQEQFERLGNAYLTGGRYALWSCLFIACPIAVYAHEFITLYIGPEFIQSAVVIVLISICYPFNYSNHMLPKIAIATARVRVFFLSTFGAQILVFLAMLYFVYVHQLGAIGVALATAVVVLILDLIVFIPMGLKLSNLKLRRFLKETLWPGLAPAAGAIVIWLGLKWLQPPDTWMQLIGFALIGHVFYLGILYRCLSAREMSDLRLGLQKLKERFAASR